MRRPKHRGRKKPDIRAKRVAAGLLAGKSDVRAVVEAGYSPETARSSAYDIVRRPLVQSALTEALEASGITTQKLGQVLAEGLDAKMIVFDPNTGGGTMVNLPAHAIRFKAYDRVVQAYGYVPRQIEMPAPPSKGLTVLIREAHVTMNQAAVPAAPATGGNGEERMPPRLRVTIRPANGEAR